MTYSGARKRVLFLCSRNQWRSPTAERVFSSWPELEVLSAGLDKSAVEIVSPEMLAWADVVFVMEKSHRSKLLRQFRAFVKDQKVIVLGIPDKYRYMDPLLVALLKKAVPAHLGLEERA